MRFAHASRDCQRSLYSFDSLTHQHSDIVPLFLSANIAICNPNNHLRGTARQVFLLENTHASVWFGFKGLVSTALNPVSLLFSCQSVHMHMNDLRVRDDLAAFCTDEPLPVGRDFYGALSGRVQARGLTFAQLTHDRETCVPVHTHASCYYSLMLSGRYEEYTRCKRSEFRPFTSALNLKDVTHAGRVYRNGARFFTITIGNEWISQVPRPLACPTIVDSAGGCLTCIGLRIFREFRGGLPACRLTVESLVWELLASACGEHLNKLVRRPVWLDRVIDLLHSEFSREIRVDDLAREAEVHPTHLARTFRKFYHQTPGEYKQRLRVNFAVRRLAESQEDVALVAAEAGFADQSHLTRVFKRYLLTTPVAFRRSIA